jgi:uridine phosphorylase
VAIHLIPTAEVAPRALLPGDPGRALALAQLLLDAPRMCNHARGLWGYTGTAADGRALTVQATGIGGASTAAVLEDLAELGVRTALRLGTCRADGAEPALGTVLTVGRVLAEDGIAGTAARSHPQSLDAPDAAWVHPDPAFAGDAVVVSRDRLAPEPTGAAPVADRTTAAFLVVCAELGVRAGALLAVTSRAGGARLDAEALLAAEHELGLAGAALLGLPPRGPVA